jgi:A/G-specific adenine glycosylase
MQFTPNDNEKRKIGHLIADWFVKNQRILPWRANPSIYNRLISEFMLQQTQVTTVIPYFNRWIEQFPSIEAVAKAPEEQILKAWEGLGYYARVRNLHRTAKKITSKEINLTTPKHSIFPKTPEEWKQLPGIGDYTAHALAAIAQNQHIAAIDGNVIRVLCRANGIQRAFKSKNQAIKLIKDIAHSYIPFGKSADYNEGIMELGALICKFKNPACDCCPIYLHCCSFQKKLDYTQIPKFQKTIYIKKTVQRVFICNEQFIILKKTNGKRLHNIFELPLLDNASQKIPLQEIAKINRSIANERIVEIIFTPKDLQKNLENLTNDHADWVRIPIHKLKTITLSGPYRRWLDGQLSARL